MKEFKDVNKRVIERDCILHADNCFAKVISLGNLVYITAWHLLLKSVVEDNEPVLDLDQKTIDADKVKIEQYKPLGVFDSEGREYLKYDTVEDDSQERQVLGVTKAIPPNFSLDKIIISSSLYPDGWVARMAKESKILRSETDEVPEDTFHAHSAAEQNKIYDKIFEGQGCIEKAKPEPLKEIEKLMPYFSDIKGMPNSNNLYCKIREIEDITLEIVHTVNKITERMKQCKNS